MAKPAGVVLLRHRHRDLLLVVGNGKIEAFQVVSISREAVVLQQHPPLNGYNSGSTPVSGNVLRRIASNYFPGAQFYETRLFFPSQEGSTQLLPVG
ncbi:MAG: hypothetical protein HY982_01235 [Candidatus Magasanikbacteria bacterium]|nr:hypothetical protein [Candidatus Magasanikbacteria bacterium]